MLLSMFHASTLLCGTSLCWDSITVMLPKHMRVFLEPCFQLFLHLLFKLSVALYLNIACFLVSHICCSWFLKHHRWGDQQLHNIKSRPVYQPGGWCGCQRWLEVVVADHRWACAFAMRVGWWASCETTQTHEQFLLYVEANSDIARSKSYFLGRKLCPP